jgi:hypothetical protein
VQINNSNLASYQIHQRHGSLLVITSRICNTGFCNLDTKRLYFNTNLNIKNISISIEIKFDKSFCQWILLKRTHFSMHNFFMVSTAVSWEIMISITKEWHGKEKSYQDRSIKHQRCKEHIQSLSRYQVHPRHSETTILVVASRGGKTFFCKLDRKRMYFNTNFDMDIDAICKQIKLFKSVYQWIALKINHYSKCNFCIVILQCNQKSWFLLLKDEIVHKGHIEIDSSKIRGVTNIFKVIF